MTSSIHIFDEFQELVECLSDSERHRKRVELERLVFSALKTRYGAHFKAFWQSYIPPVYTKKKIVIIERRIHENLEFILQNCAWAGAEGGWGLAIVCSDMNLKYIQDLVGDKRGYIQIIPHFKGNPPPAEGKREYNDLLQKVKFYDLFNDDHLCLVEMDCYFRKPIPDSVLTCDYIASPYAWDPLGAGGGLSFRNRNVMREVCWAYPEKREAQDIFMSDNIRALGFSMPPLLYSKDIVAESILDADPVGVHQWWTFFSPKLENAEEIFHRFMTIEGL